jgi:endonuclease IV
MIHANNTGSPRGTHRDRHAHLREGLIQAEAFAALFSYPWPDDFPVILETPEIGSHWDEINLEAIRAFARMGTAAGGSEDG